MLDTISLERTVFLLMPSFIPITTQTDDLAEFAHCSADIMEGKEDVSLLKYVCTVS